MSLGGRVSAFFERESPAWPLAVCRIGIGLAVTVRGLKSVRDLYLLAFDPATVPARLWPWAPNLDTVAEIALFGLVWLGACLGLVLGFHARLSATVLLVLTLFLHIVDQNFWAHHVYFMSLLLLLLAVSESDRMWSVHWLRNGSPGDRWVRAWPVWLLQLQLSIVYFYTAVAKVNETFLSGQVLLGRLALPGLLQVQPLPGLIAASTVLVEFFLAGALWHPRTRTLGFVAGILLHGLIPVFMGLYAGLIVFSLLVFSVYALFLDNRRRATPGRA